MIKKDKPIYKPGDKLNYKFMIINPLTRILHNNRNYGTISIKDSKGSVIHTETNYQGKGIYSIPETANGGQYSVEIKLDYYSGGYLSYSNYTVQAFSNPRMLIDLMLLKKGYGENEQVEVISFIKRSDGSLPENAEVEYTISLDGKTLKSESIKLEKSDEGKKKFSFMTPQFLSPQSNMIFSLKVIDNGIVEQKTKTIPLIVSEEDLEVKFYPEGGNIVLGSENTIYFEALSKSGDPIDLEAQLINLSEQKVEKTIESKHEGRGSFTFTPKKSLKYSFKIVRPKQSKLIDLPLAEEEGVIVNFAKTIVDTDDPIAFNILNTFPEKKQFKISIYQKEKEISSRIVNLSSLQSNSVEISLPPESVGVLRFTVYEVKINKEKSFFPNTKDSSSETQKKIFL
jgi:alpha-2-macroglobulin-like protein